MEGAIRPIRAESVLTLPGMNQQLEPLLKPSEVMSYLGVNRKTLRRYVADGKLPVVVVSPRTLRFHKSDVLAITSVEKAPRRRKRA